jgi:polyisoprenoid-binding protein YceI
MTVNGDLTIKGTTKPVSMQFTMVGPVTDQRGNVKMGFVAGTSINRRDFGVNYGGNLPNGTPVLSDIIPVEFQIEANKKK